MNPAVQPEHAMPHRGGRLGWAVLVVSSIAVVWEIGHALWTREANPKHIRVFVCQGDGSPVRARLEGPDGTVFVDEQGIGEVPNSWRGSTALIFHVHGLARPAQVLIPAHAADLVRLVLSDD